MLTRSKKNQPRFTNLATFWSLPNASQTKVIFKKYYQKELQEW